MSTSWVYIVLFVIIFLWVGIFLILDIEALVALFTELGKRYAALIDRARAVHPPERRKLAIRLVLVLTGVILLLVLELRFLDFLIHHTVTHSR